MSNIFYPGVQSSIFSIFLYCCNLLQCLLEESTETLKTFIFEGTWPCRYLWSIFGILKYLNFVKNFFGIFQFCSILESNLHYYFVWLLHGIYLCVYQATQWQHILQKIIRDVILRHFFKISEIILNVQEIICYLGTIFFKFSQPAWDGG